MIASLYDVNAQFSVIILMFVPAFLMIAPSCRGKT